jgi:hypothetical protein
MVMSNLEMLIYTAFNGIETTVRWRNEREFDAVKKFLTEIGAHVMGISENNKPTGEVFVDVETKEQVESLRQFVESFRQESQA